MAADPLEIVASTAQAAFATDEKGRVVIWNQAAEELTGYRASRVLGKPCHAVLRGSDIFGNSFCCDDCNVLRMARQRDAIRGFEMEIRDESGGPLRVGVSILVVPGPRPSQWTMVHLLQLVQREREVDEIIQRILGSGPPLALPVSGAGAVSPPPAQLRTLTPRELEILRLLADGTGTREIADSLFISVTTVRNHVQNILRKLEVHSKLEAVSLALRCRFI